MRGFKPGSKSGDLFRKKQEVIAGETYTYQAYYKIIVRGNLVSVFDSRYPHESALFRTTTLYEAMRWVEAFLDGRLMEST